MSWEEVIKGHRTRTGKTRTKEKEKDLELLIQTLL